MPRPKKVRERIEIVLADGWYRARTSGSYRQYHHPVKRGTVTIAGTPSMDLHPRIVKRILDQAQIEEEER
jgi:predicted RNA binding protein YcfA (HicA-like mRNA interferase family)